MTMRIDVQAYHSPNSEDKVFHINRDCRDGNPTTRIAGTGGDGWRLCHTCRDNLRDSECRVHGSVVENDQS